MTARSVRQLDDDQRAVAMVEAVLVLMPLLFVFLVLMELSRLGIASLMLQRSAGIAVRACAVVKDQPVGCDSNRGFDKVQNTLGQDEIITLAAREALRPLSEATLSIDSALCQVNAAGPTPPGLSVSEISASGTDLVDVVGRYRCVVPLARDIICHWDSKQPQLPAHALMHATARHAHQGAHFECDYAGDFESNF